MITLDCVEREINELMENGEMCMEHLEQFNALCEAMGYLTKMHREFTEDDARAWVAALDPPARWTKDQTTDVMNKLGYHHKPCEFWAAMNMLLA